jgi:hypothetical protein
MRRIAVYTTAAPNSRTSDDEVSVPVSIESKGWAIGPILGPGHFCPLCFWSWCDFRSERRSSGPATSASEDAVSVATQLLKRYASPKWDTCIGYFSSLDAEPQWTPVLNRLDCSKCGGGTAHSLSLIDRLNRLANPFTGIVARVNVIASAHERSWAHATTLLPAPHLPQGASGSGTSVPEARCRMLMEAVERFCCSHDAASDPEGVPIRTIRGDPAGFLPAGKVYFGYPGIATNTNGCAAAPSLDQAIRHGLLEVMERDAVAKWWIERRAVKRLPLIMRTSTIDRSWMLALTPDSPVQVCVAVSSHADGSGIYLGAAADLTWEAASQRAATEMLQFRLWDQITGVPPDRLSWMQANTLDHSPWLAGTTIPSWSASPTVRTLPSQATWADLTRPWLGIPTVRVFVPGSLDLTGIDLPL